MRCITTNDGKKFEVDEIVRKQNGDEFYYNNDNSKIPITINDDSILLEVIVL